MHRHALRRLRMRTRNRRARGLFTRSDRSHGVPAAPDCVFLTQNDARSSAANRVRHGRTRLESHSARVARSPTRTWLGCNRCGSPAGREPLGPTSFSGHPYKEGAASTSNRPRAPTPWLRGSAAGSLALARRILRVARLRGTRIAKARPEIDRCLSTASSPTARSHPLSGPFLLTAKRRCRFFKPWSFLHRAR